MTRGPESFYLRPHLPERLGILCIQPLEDVGVEDAYLLLKLLGLEVTPTSSTLFYW